MPFDRVCLQRLFLELVRKVGLTLHCGRVQLHSPVRTAIKTAVGDFDIDPIVLYNA